MEEIAILSPSRRPNVKDFEKEELFEIRYAIFDARYFDALVSIYREGVEFLCWFEGTNFYFKEAWSGRTLVLTEKKAKNCVKAPGFVCISITIALRNIAIGTYTEAA